MARQAAGAVERAVRRDLSGMEGPFRDGPLAQQALALARVLDETSSARDVASVSKELRATLAELRALAPAKVAADPVDELQAKRARRRGA